MLRACAVTIACCLLPAIDAQESRSAAAVTASGRTLDRALDTVLGGGGRGAPEARTIALLIDPTPAVKNAGFLTALRAGLTRNATRLTRSEIGIAGLGAGQDIRWFPGTRPGPIVAAATTILARPKDAIRNVYEDIRAAADAFPKSDGRRELTLVSLTNGDAEDNLETTVNALNRAGLVFRCITSESYLADSYWAARPYQKPPRKCQMTGGDSAFVDLPWGWLMQTTVANEVAPSSVPVYGLSRLVAATKGSAHLYSQPSTHRCSVYGTCLFCSNDHAGANDTYWRARLSRYAPSTQPRRDVYAAAASDPAFRAMLVAWNKAARAGLVRGTPSVKITGNGLAPQRPRLGRVPALFLTSGFKRNAQKALKLSKECDKIGRALARRLAAIGSGKGIPRYRAMAEFTVVMLQLTKVNLITYAGWCKEIAPGWTAKNPPEHAAPEVDPVDRTRRAAGIAISNYSLCHGVRPFFKIELPGGKPLRDELAKLDALAVAFETLYGHTPIAAGLHRSGIAHFRLTYPGIVGTHVRRKKPRSSNDRDPVTERGRPARPGRSSGGSAGPTTGK